MIGRLKGELVEKQSPNILIDVNGVGYELQAPMTTCFSLPDLGKTVVLYTHFSVSENAQQLFGFLTQHDREFFRILIKVSGVGPKMAVGIMSMDTSEIVRCIMDDNVTALVKIPGVGKKTAERLIIETRDKVKAWATPSENTTETVVLSESASPASGMVAEAESALVALGYRPVEAAKAVSKAMKEAPAKSEELIRIALKGMLPA